MTSVKVRAQATSDGEVKLSGLPFAEGVWVDALVSVVEEPRKSAVLKARRAWAEMARASRLKTEGPYPTRDELHERN